LMRFNKFRAVTSSACRLINKISIVLHHKIEKPNQLRETHNERPRR
jgi:hypothetical protein